MSGTEGPLGDDGGPSLDKLLDCLEAALQRLADPAAPLDQAVADYEQARRLLAAAEARLEVAGRRVALIGRDPLPTPTSQGGGRSDPLSAASPQAGGRRGRD